jgi:hypothetical protein
MIKAHPKFLNLHIECKDYSLFGGKAQTFDRHKKASSFKSKGDKDG